MVMDGAAFPRIASDIHAFILSTGNIGLPILQPPCCGLFASAIWGASRFPQKRIPSCRRVRIRPTSKIYNRALATHLTPLRVSLIQHCLNHPLKALQQSMMDDTTAGTEEGLV
jgi:hypothetical protein